VDKVFAFEPFALVRAFIEDKIALNGLTNVIIFPFALGETDGDVPYFPASDGNSGAGTLIENRLNTSADPAIVQIRRGDSFLKKESLPRIDIIKADVEGFEAFVFRGLSDRIRQDKPAILLEISDDSREGFGSEDAFKHAFYEGALFAEVTGSNGRPYKLKPFNYGAAAEVLVMPPEMSGLMKRLSQNA
jgi:FkbM family methyltransferase